ncbi:MAG: sigma-70 family RNA polymerase sigma factor, partial [Saprospiraceae bacterium]
ISYAVWWIRQAILQAIIEYSRIVRLPHNRTKEYLKIHAEYNQFIQKNEREPTYEEMAEIMGRDIETIQSLLGNTQKHVSVDAPISDDIDAIPIIDLMSVGDEDSPDMGLMQESFRMEILESMEHLSPREIQVVSAFYGLDGEKPLTLEEISMKFNLSRERVRQVKERAIRRMRRTINRITTNSYNF